MSHLVKCCSNARSNCPCPFPFWPFFDNPGQLPPNSAEADLPFTCARGGGLAGTRCEDIFTGLPPALRYLRGVAASGDFSRSWSSACQKINRTSETFQYTLYTLMIQIAILETVGTATFPKGLFSYQMVYLVV